jgi:hypothetical protein
MGASGMLQYSDQQEKTRNAKSVDGQKAQAGQLLRIYLWKENGKQQRNFKTNGRKHARKPGRKVGGKHLWEGRDTPVYVGCLAFGTSDTYLYSRHVGQTLRSWAIMRDHVAE